MGQLSGGGRFGFSSVSGGGFGGRSSLWSLEQASRAFFQDITQSLYCTQMALEGPGICALDKKSRQTSRLLIWDYIETARGVPSCRNSPSPKNRQRPLVAVQSFRAFDELRRWVSCSDGVG